MKLQLIQHSQMLRFLTALGLSLLASGCVSSSPSEVSTPKFQNNSALNEETFTLSILGTNDVHGQLIQQRGRGGLVSFSGYVSALRAAREQDGGALLLIDAGDMWQGTLESNLSEGAATLNAYNQLNYTAAALGNHEFDFGPIGELTVPQSSQDDPRGVLKQRAADANFPMLAANLIDVDTGQPVVWPNVQPSVLITVKSIKVGIIGVMTAQALSATIPANTVGLRVSPLAPAITQEAKKLRILGANLIIVAAHAGGSCDEFDDPMDLSSCELDSEIMQVARAIPADLVDHIVAGHRHRGIAHFINGIGITSNFGGLRTFGRVDFEVNQRTKSIVDTRIYPPHVPCVLVDSTTNKCVWEDDGSANLKSLRYANQAVEPLNEVVDIVARVKAQVAQLKNQKIGVFLETPITNANKPESVLGNLFTDGMVATSGADIAIHNVTGGLRSDLPPGELRFGSVFQMFPFDNRTVVLDIIGADLKKVVTEQSKRESKRMGFAGFRVFQSCRDGNDYFKLMLTNNGKEILDDDRLKLTVNDFLAMGGDNILTPIIPEGGYALSNDTPLARDDFVKWLGKRGGRLNAEQLASSAEPRWVVENSCQ